MMKKRANLLWGDALGREGVPSQSRWYTPRLLRPVHSVVGSGCDDRPCGSSRHQHPRQCACVQLCFLVQCEVIAVGASAGDVRHTAERRCRYFGPVNGHFPKGHPSISQTISLGSRKTQRQKESRRADDHCKMPGRSVRRVTAFVPGVKKLFYPLKRPKRSMSPGTLSRMLDGRHRSVTAATASQGLTRILRR